MPVIGRLVNRGLDDELKGTAYADGVNGRTHHIRLPHLDTAGDGPAGSIVELRTYENARGERRVALPVCSDLALSSSPWIRDTPHRWLAKLISKIRRRVSFGIFGRTATSARLPAPVQRPRDKPDDRLKPNTAMAFSTDGKTSDRAR